MNDILRQSELFREMDETQAMRIMELAQNRSLAAGEYLFLLGEQADRLCVVLSGRLEACFPLSLGGVMKDVAVESKGPGSALGWSALVKPHRFTVSARASEPSEVATFSRQELMQRLDQDPRLGQVFISRIAEVIGRRFLTIRALWGRELQQMLASGMPIAQAEGGLD